MVILINTTPSALIGKKYIPQDNSYVQNKRDKSWASLINCPNLRIISEPYSEKTKAFPWDPDHTKTFIDVVDILSGEQYRVVYCPAWVR